MTKKCVLLFSFGLIVVLTACVAPATTTSISSPIQTNDWQQLGRFVEKGLVINASPSLAFNGESLFTSFVDKGDVIVKRWENGAWQALGKPPNKGWSNHSRILLDSSGNLFMAWNEKDASDNYDLYTKV